MIDPAHETLFYPITEGLCPLRAPILLIGGAWHPALESVKSALDVWTPNAITAQSFIQRGVKVLNALPIEGAYATVLISIPKQVEEAQFWLAHGMTLAAKDGMILAAAANDANGNRIEKWMKEADMETQSFSKNKAKIVMGARPKARPAILSQWLDFGGIHGLQSDDDTTFLSQPGLFGWDRIDVGSALLNDNLTSGLKGVGADFGCGYGYLSRMILAQNAGIKSLHLIDVDSRALECTKENIKDVQGMREIHFHWADLSKPVAAIPPLDFIVMNPPFHSAKKAENTLGQSFIVTARHHLKKSGALYMVANIHLPYEDVLKKHFSKYEVIVIKDGFKVFRAVV